MFERLETWSFDAPAPQALYDGAWRVLSAAGFAITANSSYSFQGKSVNPTWGLHRLLEVTVLPQGQGSSVQLRFRAAPTDEGLAVGVVGAVLLFPVAVVGGVISWDKYETDWKDTRSKLWTGLVNQYGAKPSAQQPPPPAAQPPPPPSPPAQVATAQPPALQAAAAPPPVICPSCKGELPPNAKFCHLCGAKLDGERS